MATIPTATEESIKLWLKVGNLKKLEQAVLDGYGEQLRGRNSRIPKINKFLKRVPHFQTKIAAVHSAVGEGNLRELQNLLDRKGLIYARGSSGETPFHTAVLNKQIPIIEYMLEKYPAVIHARDNQGRTPLHYSALIENGEDIFNMLIEAGADKEVKDLMGKTPKDYSENPGEYILKQSDNSQEKFQSREVSSMLRQPSPITLMTKTEIRAMIQRGDLAKIERAIMNGYGERFLGETAISTRVRELLESIPEHLKKLVSLQTAIETGSLRQVQNLINRKGLVIAKDNQGLTILHKAVLHGQKDIVQYLIEICPKAIFAKDHDKRTPVHYAAALSDDGEIYKMLTEAGGNTTLPDCDGKTPEFYRQNPSSLDLKKILERRMESSGKLSNSNNSEGGGNRKQSLRPGKRSTSGVTNTNGNTSSIVKQWLRSGDIEKLEKAVIDGHGLKLIRETTADPRARAFLRTVPAYMAKIGAIHEAVCQGSLRNFKVLMDRKKLIMSRDQLGLGVLHKAAIFGHTEIAKYLVENFPEAVTIKDKSGRTALHYAAVVKNKEEIYPMLIEVGADATQVDVKGRSAEFYLENEDELDITEIQNRINRQRNRVINAGKQRNSNTKPQENGFNINGANIRKWIHAEDIQKLEQVVLEGQGYKLLLETSNNPRVKHFLVSVPSLVNKIRDIHNAVMVGDLQGVETSIEKPSLLLSKDESGMTPLHKAVLLEQEDILQFIVNTNLQTVNVKDEDGRTALHYAAGLKDSGRTYEMLEKAGADTQAVDSRGKSSEHYLNHPGELDMRQLMAHINRNKPNGNGKQETNNNTMKRPSQPNLRPVRKAATSAINNETITKMIQQGDVEKLEQLVLDGHGKKLVGKSSWNEDVRIFLKKVPHYMDRIYAIHTASALGDLLLLQQLLDKKKMVLSKDEYGLTALHKAVKYGQMDVVKYLLQTFPACHSVKDQDGRTPLHYASMYKDRDDIYNLLVNSGADTKTQDQRGKAPDHYLASKTKLEAPTPPPKPIDKYLLENNDDISNENDIDPLEDEKEIQTWINDGDIEKLEMLLIECRGEKLLGKSSSNDKVQEFLEAVPAYMGKIRAIHNAAASGELKDLQSLIDKDILVLSVDEHGACPLHKAVLHGHKDVIKFLANNYPSCLKIKDKSGLTPLHYAALISNDGYFYRLLYNAGADPNVKDKNGFTSGQLLRGYGILMLDDLRRRYEEKKVPPRPHSVQMWERPPTEEILKALTPSPMTQEHASALRQQSAAAVEIKSTDIDDENESTEDEVKNDNTDLEIESNSQQYASDDVGTVEESEEKVPDQINENVEDGPDGTEQDADDEESKESEEDAEEGQGNENQTDESIKKINDEDLTEKESEKTVDNEENKKSENDKPEELADIRTDENDIGNNLEGEEQMEKDAADEKEDESEKKQEDIGQEETDENVVTSEVSKDIEGEIEPETIEAEQEDNSSKPDAVEQEINSNKPDEAEEESPSKPDGGEEESPSKLDEDEENSNKPDEDDVKDIQENGTEQPSELVNDLNVLDQQAVEAVPSLAEKPEDETSADQEIDRAEESSDDVIESKENLEDSGIADIDDDLENSKPKSLNAQQSSEDDDVVTSSINDIQESLSEDNNNSFHIFQPTLNGGNPLHWTKEGEYLSVVLGDALITALADVSRIKPADPLAYLAVLLYRYLHKANLSTDMNTNGLNGRKRITNGQNGQVNGIKLRLLNTNDGNITLQDICRIKGDDGSTLVHYAAAKPHDNYGFFELLKETNYNIAERDNFYRTIRDIANEKGLEMNVESIDKYIFYLVREGKENEIETLILDGYDHLLDILDDEGNDTIMVAELTQQMRIAQCLKEVPQFQEKLELLHESVRNGDVEEVKNLLENEPKLVKAKNSKGQTALHMAILTENEDLIKIITNACQPVVNIEDNMGRTPLHYAMGTNNPEIFGKFVIQMGGNQLTRDVACHLPSFYFINNQAIQKLKEEMEEIKV